MEEYVTPDEVRATVIADSGTAKNGGPAVSKFAKKYDLDHKTVSDHCTGRLWPGKWPKAFYKLVKEMNNENS